MLSSIETVMSDEEPPTDFLFLLFLLSCEAISKAAGPVQSRVSEGSVVAPVDQRSPNFQNLDMSAASHVTRFDGSLFIFNSYSALVRRL